MANAQTHGSCLQLSELGHTPARKEVNPKLGEWASQLNIRREEVCRVHVNQKCVKEIQLTPPGFGAAGRLMPRAAS